MVGSVFLVDPNATTVAQQGTPDYTGVSLHTSAQALPIPILWGTRRISPNIIWQSSIDTSNSQPNPSGDHLTAVSLGGNGYSTAFDTLPPGTVVFSPRINPVGPWQGALFLDNPPLPLGAHVTTYGTDDPSNSASIWWVPMIFALCEGPIDTILRMWNPGGAPAINFDLSTYSPTLSPPSLFYTTFLGTSSQTAWGYFAAANTVAGGPYYVGQDLAYRNTAYIASAVVNTGHNRQTPQQSFEVVRTPDTSYRVVDSYGIGFDMSPSYFIPDFLTNPQYGMGLASGDLDATSLLFYKQYTFAQGLYFSPLLNSQSAGTDLIDQWALESNTWIFWDGTTIRFVPLGDETLTANGQTYTPDTTPAYSLGPNDYVDGLLQVDRADVHDCNNRLVVEFSDRRADYAKNPIEWKDTTLVNLFGVRDANSVSCDDICDVAVAAKVVELLGKRAAYIRNIYSFSLGYPKGVRLLPGTILTLNDPILGLVEVPVRVRSVDEDEKGAIAIVAEEYPGTLGLSRPMPAQTWSSAGVGAGGGGSSTTGGTSTTPPPGPPIGGTTTVGAPAQMFLIQAVPPTGYTITLGTIIPGVLYLFKHVGGAAGSNRFERSTAGATQYVTLDRGSNTFTIEDPQDPVATAAANTTTLRTSGVTYQFMLDATSNIFRAIGMA